MTDLIKREDAIMWFEPYADRGLKIPIETVIQNLKDIPSAENKGEWIPCSERLPEENVVVLTQAKFKDDIKMAVSARQDYNYWTGWGTREVNIVAWMSLPPAWEGADDEGVR